MADTEAVKHFVGLSHGEAVALAAREGRVIVDRSPNFGRRRADHKFYRVNVLLEDDIVVRADLG